MASPSRTTTAKGRYDSLSTLRWPYLIRGRDCSALTIPTLLPPMGSTGATKLPTPHQATGARGVNNLAARLLMTMLPANAPFFRFLLDDYTVQKLAGQPNMRAQVELAMDRMERSIMTEIETGRSTRASVFEAFKHLLVTGNVLLFVPPEGGLKVYRLDRFVVKRDPMGHPLEIITQEFISPLELPEDLRNAVEQAEGENDTKDEEASTEDTEELYTHIRLTPSGWEVYQEVEGNVVPGSEGFYPKDKLPWLPLRLIKVDGEDYGRGYVEEYFGDLKALEGLSKAILESAAAAAKVVFLVRPNGTTKMKVIAEAESGDIVSGNKDDVTVLQMDKYADFKVAYETRQSIKEDLSYAFLLNSAIQRSGERVTAEEIRYMAQELESALGGIYSMLAQEFQLPYVSLVMVSMQSRGKLPKLPKGVIRPAITTGVEALGRGNDRAELAGLLQDIAPLGPDVIASHLNVDDYISRMAASRGIDPQGLIPTPEEIQQRQQQQAMQAMVEKLGPNAINQAGGMARDAMAGSNQPTPQR